VPDDDQRELERAVSTPIVNGECLCAHIEAFSVSLRVQSVFRAAVRDATRRGGLVDEDAALTLPHHGL
jgi:hypothetical protein